ncbi:hypothetical protein CAL18_14690 [Bordetella genomosp. 7]|uniref:pentapeptide repeat-containing protein n=1 Tax=Bordetella genomosp. 7 TaxID=1416805 RepID=UPI000B9E2D78|nr:pentapeptide repeat-containing protein [Bordetella genomosp. 7]OZI17379.1 hypothetical protein CAL18_14690 [Bordetella genomosp. 7]
MEKSIDWPDDAAVFHRTRLPDARFDGCDLEYADYAYADISGATFRRADFSRTKFHRAQTDPNQLPRQGGILMSDPALYEAEAFTARAGGQI